MEPFEFKEIVFCYSTGKNPRNDQDDADDAIGLLKTAGKTFGIVIE